MTTTVQDGSDTTTRISRRALFAKVLLTASPREMSVLSEGKIRVVFDSIAELQQWLADDGILKAEPDLLTGEHTSTATDGRRRRSMSAYPDDFYGWEIFAEATDCSEPAPLDDATREQLRAVADEPATAEAGTSR